MSTSNKIFLLRVCEEQEMMVIDYISYPGMEMINFPIVSSRDKLADYPFSMPWSFTASPARYGEAALHKFYQNYSASLFLINPLAEISEIQYSFLLQHIKQMDKSTCRLLANETDLPIGLFIPENCAALFNDVFFPRFMSWLNASLDFTLLGSALDNLELEIIRLAMDINSKSHFYLKSEYHTIYKLMATHYLKAVQANRFSKPSKHIAIMPYHAGDVLFFIQALKETPHDFTAIMVNACYADIIEKMMPGFPIIKIHKDPTNRGKNEDSDQTIHFNDESFYFLLEIYPQIPKDATFYFFRPYRDYNMSNFHLIDGFKFAIGNEFTLLPLKDESPEVSCINKDKSILIHFDGGWPLKIYPYHYQQKLTNLLKKAGYKITILSNKKPLLNDVDAYLAFTTLENLEKMIQSHTLFLGMDSFPNHFATHVLNHPTITLFSSTREENSNAPYSSIYKSISKKKGCSPCGNIEHCPRYNASYCHNFTEPQNVFNAIENMRQEIERLAKSLHF